MPNGRSISFGLVLVSISACFTARPASAEQPIASVPNYSSPDIRSLQLLAAHNRERVSLNIPPLRWDPALAASAASYGPALSSLGTLRHSPRGHRPGQSENLWMGTRGAYAPEQMVGSWIEERQHFRSGVFPGVSTTGNWLDVGHYTQLIWRGTTAVGCAVHRDARWDYLICRYSPKGNVDGQRVP